MKAILYARFSTEHQTEASIADQFRVCRDHALTRHWQIGGQFKDEGISGAVLGNRPGVQQALQSVRPGDVLLVADLSRLSRSQDLAPLLSRLGHRDVRVIGVLDGFDSDSRTARMQAGLSGIMSEEFRTMVADRTRSALELRARTGQPTGGKAYDNRDIVNEIFVRFAQGETMRAIADDLNRRGVPSPGADWKPRTNVRGKWLTSTLHAMLRNEKYIGRQVWNRTQWLKDPDTGKRVRRERPASEWVEGSCEPFVTRQVWDAAQARLQQRTPADRRASYLLSGVLECGLCESKLVVVGAKGARYACGAYKAGGRHACSNDTSFPRVPAEAAILQPTLDDMLSPVAVTEGVKLLREARAAAERAYGNPAADAERELAELTRLVQTGTVSTEVMAPAIAEAKRRVKTARESGGATLGLPWPTERLWRDSVAQMRAILTGDDVQAARDVLKKILRQVRCTPEGDHVVAEVHWYWLLLATGTDEFCGSGGLLRQKVYLPRYLKSKQPTRYLRVIQTLRRKSK